MPCHWRQGVHHELAFHWPEGVVCSFRYFNSFGQKQAAPNSLDVIIGDEAHRLWETSNYRFTPKALRSDISRFGRSSWLPA